MNTHKQELGTRRLSFLQEISLTLFLGVFIGNTIIITALWSTDLNQHTITSFKTYSELISLLLKFYPVALIIGGVPAVITAIVIRVNRPTNFHYIHAFFVGAFVSLAVCVIPLNAVAVPVSLIGGIAAVVVRYAIKKIETKMNASTQ